MSANKQTQLSSKLSSGKTAPQQHRTRSKKPTRKVAGLPAELVLMVRKSMLPDQRMFDLRLAHLVNLDPSLANRGPRDSQTDVEANANSRAHAQTHGQGRTRSEPPITLTLDRAFRRETLKSYTLLRQPLPRLNLARPAPVKFAYFNPEIDILHLGSKQEYLSLFGNRQGPTLASFRDKALIQRVAVPNEYFASINYATGPKPALLNYPALKEIIVLVPHLHTCIHGNEARTSLARSRYPKEYYVEKFVNLVTGKWIVEMTAVWGGLPWIRYVGSCACDRPVWGRFGHGLG
ncbi:hypothetical protein NHQ30_005838 [Ciborinia camelliae]|nr:hypothetical protein NHQ30_005838 [Ciborinia camelliae]